MKKTFLSNGPLETKTLATEIKEYLQNGDVILLNKIDLVKDEDIDVVTKRIRKICCFL